MSVPVFNVQIAIVVKDNKLIGLTQGWSYKSQYFNRDCQQLTILYTTFYKDTMKNTELLRKQLYPLLETYENNLSSCVQLPDLLVDYKAAHAIKEKHLITKQNVDIFKCSRFHCIFVFLDGISNIPPGVIETFNIDRYFVNLDNAIEWLCGHKINTTSPSDDNFPSLIPDKKLDSSDISNAAHITDSNLLHSFQRLEILKQKILELENMSRK